MLEVMDIGRHCTPQIVTLAFVSNPVPDMVTVCPPAVPPSKYQGHIHVFKIAIV